MPSIFIPPHHFATISEEDVSAVKAVGRWSYSSGYICHWRTDSTGKRSRLWLHRFIAERMFGSIPAGMQIDHINADRKDCRRNNLRRCSRSQNQAAKQSQKNSKIRKGITLRANRYDVRIRYCGRRLYLGRYSTVETSMRVYAYAHRLLWGEFTTETNVPEPAEELKTYVLSRLKRLGVEGNES